ncbi:uncharacterized protein BT62DRAFT_926904 [Guyanagaster necrorhizus]|uniref:MI domain-containing protein n=1 Tax=Guyanagaster necrorhizus TaxID=856835 RepID=A0A9P7W0V8_9AGAR|nr:uncharacterized protein BT62DRAFT_926904 [Guyanagaster necrorhizus MCA 3950]KAG7451246.1 hypothetical protein BT62DRAFT_926904 [Guyanagaster necrorhizus MCA 3950]
MSSRSKNTTRLPPSILEQINGPSGNDEPRRRKHKATLSRKESRKQERHTKKQNKAVHFSGGPRAPKRPAEEELHDSSKRKKARLESSPNSAKTVVMSAPSSAEKTVKPLKKPPTPLEKLVSGFKAKSQPRTSKEMEEDRYIVYLESKLGSKGKRESGEDDGLDELLDFTSSIGLNVPDELEDETDVNPESNDSEKDAQEEDLELKSSDYSDESAGALGDVAEDDDEYEEWHGINSSSSDSRKDRGQTSEVPTVSHYIPPHLRHDQTFENDSEEVIKLKRNLKGLLNRMSEQNLASILDGIEEQYRKHRRHDVTSTITALIVEGISVHSSLLDSYVVLHAAFVSSLHKVVGIEFAAYFVQTLVSSYEKYYQTIGSNLSSEVEEGTKGKECSNLIVLLSELYNFQVISCVLVFDIIRGILESKFSEFNIELLLKMLRSSGKQLRHDDPSALKSITEIFQKKLSEVGEKPSSRTLFMVETLTNLKNNKVKKLATQNQGGEAVERMKKFLSALSKKRHVATNEPLRVSLADLHFAESKGKWWLVGAAWGGDPLVDHHETQKEAASGASSVASSNNALLKLARKQGMNTDIRRSIFVILMNSEDYVDACDRLSQLNLSEVQQREIIRVLLHCCGNEKTYNPYYTLVCQHLCRLSHSYKVTLQFCLWDFLRDLGEAEVGGAEVIKSIKESGVSKSFDLKSISSIRLRNVAKAYAWWMSKDCVTLAILKPVDFTLLKPQTKQFIGEMLCQLFISTQTSSPLIGSNAETLSIMRNRVAIEEVFIKATKVQNLAMGLVYFLSNFTQDDVVIGETMVKFIRWATEVAKDTLRTVVNVIPNL